MNFLKRCFIFLVLSSLCINVFSKELEGVDLTFVHKALNAKLWDNCYEAVEDKISFLKSELNQIVNAEISQEAKLIATVLLKLEIENIKNTEALRLQMESEKNKKNKKKTNQEDLNPEAKEVILSCFEQYQNFKKENKDLSSYFYFHYNETMYATLPYLSKSEMLKMMTKMPEDYKKLEEQNPDFSETLNMYGAVLFFMPGAFGGNKKLGEEKIKKAIDTALCDFEKANALALYAQILFEKKDKENACAYMEQAIKICPTNLALLKILDANKAGYSIFKMKDYEKTLEKDSL